MPVDVQKYCGVQISNTDGAVVVANASAVEAGWDTAAALWDDGTNQWIFWGLTEGEMTIYELELIPPAPATITVIADYSTCYSVTLTYGKPAPQDIIVFDQVCYYFGTESKRLKPLGELYVMEGGLIYKILKENL